MKLSIGSRIKEARKIKGYSQEYLATLLDVSKGAVGNYESDYSSPKDTVLIKLFNVLDIDANYIFQDVMPLNKRNPPPLTAEEVKLLGYYKTLNEEGREKLLDYAEDLAASGRYAPLKVAARTGHTISTLPDDPDSFPDAPDTI